jgi:hypothetical protein
VGCSKVLSDKRFGEYGRPRRVERRNTRRNAIRPISWGLRKNCATGRAALGRMQQRLWAPPPGEPGEGAAQLGATQTAVIVARTLISETRTMNASASPMTSLAGRRPHCSRSYSHRAVRQTLRRMRVLLVMDQPHRLPTDLEREWFTRLPTCPFVSCHAPNRSMKGASSKSGALTCAEAVLPDCGGRRARGH